MLLSLFLCTILFRYDYENVDSEDAKKMMSVLEETITKPSFIGTKLGKAPDIYTVETADNFSYTDPTDESVTTNQVMYIY